MRSSWYGMVRLVRCTEEEKYGTVRTHLGSTATPYILFSNPFYDLMSRRLKNIFKKVKCHMVVRKVPKRVTLFELLPYELIRYMFIVQLWCVFQLPQHNFVYVWSIL